MRNYSSTFLRSLRSRPVTALPRYYGRSDSCSPGSSASSGMNTVSTSKQVSLIHVSGLPIIPSPTTLCAPDAAFTRYPSARRASLRLGSGLRLSLAGSPTAPGRIEFVILRTDRSPPAARHLASWRRSYSRLQAGERIPGEDLHLSGQHAFRRTRGGPVWPPARLATTPWNPAGSDFFLRITPE